MLSLRCPNRADVTTLHRMIMESTGGVSKITPESLSSDLFDNESLDLDDTNKSSEQFRLLKSNKPIIQVIVAQEKSELIGHTIFSYYFSPWVGHCLILYDIFVDKVFRLKGKLQLIDFL